MTAWINHYPIIGKIWKYIEFVRLYFPKKATTKCPWASALWPATPHREESNPPAGLLICSGFSDSVVPNWVWQTSYRLTSESCSEPGGFGLSLLESSLLGLTLPVGCSLCDPAAICHTLSPQTTSLPARPAILTESQSVREEALLRLQTSRQEAPAGLFSVSPPTESENLMIVVSHH